MNCIIFLSLKDGSLLLADNDDFSSQCALFRLFSHVFECASYCSTSLVQNQPLAAVCLAINLSRWRLSRNLLVRPKVCPTMYGDSLTVIVKSFMNLEKFQNYLVALLMLQALSVVAAWSTNLKWNAGTKAHTRPIG